MQDWAHIAVSTPFNAGVVRQTQEPGRYPVDVLTTKGTFERVKWCGFIDVEDARRLVVKGAQSVKFAAFYYDIGTETTELARGKQLLQGCYYEGAIWCVLVKGRPRIVTSRYLS